MSLPLRHALLWERFDGTGTDALGNARESWADPVEVAVYCWWPSPGWGEPAAPEHAVLVTGQVAIAAPRSWNPGPRDRIALQGRVYEVVGHADDYTTGFHGWEPGIVVKAKIVEG